MAQISVIVAVYKMPQYLPRCIEGILNQTFRDLELILVDDGSPDECGEICDTYAAKDSRVKVIHKQNAGVCAARNTGLDWVYANSDSKWIFFHDNDDWIHPETLQRLLNAAEETDTAISICGYEVTTGEDPVISPEQLKPVLCSAKDFYMTKFVNATVCWGKLYRRDLFENRRYPEGKYIEDEFLTYKLLFASGNLAVIPAPLYAYFLNRAGISKKAWVPKRLDAWEAYEQQIAFFEELGDEDLIHYRYRAYFDSIWEYLQAARSAPNAPELTKEIAFMEKRKRAFLRRMWKRGYIEFYCDYEILYDSYPLLTRLYRFYLDKWINGSWRRKNRRG